MLSRRQLFKGTAAAATVAPVAAKVTAPAINLCADSWYLTLLDEHDQPLIWTNHDAEVCGDCKVLLTIRSSKPGVLDAEDVTFGGPDSGQVIHSIELRSEDAFGGFGFKESLTGLVSNLPFTTDGNPLTIYFDNGRNKVMRFA